MQGLPVVSVPLPLASEDGPESGEVIGTSTLASVVVALPPLPPVPAVPALPLPAPPSLLEIGCEQLAHESAPKNFTEVDVSGNDLLDFTLDPEAGNSSYRTIKVTRAAFDLGTLRSTAGLPSSGVGVKTGSLGFGGDF